MSVRYGTFKSGVLLLNTCAVDIIFLSWSNQECMRPYGKYRENPFWDLQSLKKKSLKLNKLYFGFFLNFFIDIHTGYSHGVRSLNNVFETCWGLSITSKNTGAF